MSTANPKLIIVGAGAAGIAAATRLIEKGFSNIIILEAENRIGGRINSVEYAGSVVDLGGQWVHGEKGNIVYEMVKDLDLLGTSHNNYMDNTYYLSDRSPVEKNLTNRLHRIAMEVFEDEDTARANPGSFGDYFVKYFNKRVEQEFKNKEALQLAEQFKDWFHKFMICLDSAKTWDEFSTTGAYCFKVCPGDQQLNWKNHGYRTILYIMMKKFPDITKQLPLDDKIFFNKEVNKIIWDDNPSNREGVTVHCTDGSYYNGDHVLVTTSLGVLQKFHKAWFSPELPPFKVNAIEGMTFGTVNKILVKFPEKWWPDDLKGFSLLWTDQDRANLVKEFPHGPQLNGRSWLEDVYGFYVIDSHPRILLGWVVGQLAEEVESISDQIALDGCMFLLRKFVGHKYKVPLADGVLRSKWKSNPHFNGSYLYVGRKMEENKATQEDLAKSLVAGNSKQTVLFAGEATNSTHYSTVHGAIETGYREAERIINIYK